MAGHLLTFRTPSRVTGPPAYRGSLHASQIRHLLLYLSLWLLVPGLSHHFYHNFLYNLLLMSALVGNIFDKWLQDPVNFGNPWHEYLNYSYYDHHSNCRWLGYSAGGYNASNYWWCPNWWEFIVRKYFHVLSAHYLGLTHTFCSINSLSALN